MHSPNETNTANKAASAPSADINLGEVYSVTQSGVEKSPLGHNGQHHDVAYDMFEESLRMDPAERDVLAKRVLLKLDLIVLPMMCIVYFFSFLDKSTLNYANAYGLTTDLGLKGNQYSWIASITNFGYLFGAYPMSIGLQKFSIGRFIGSSVAVWGIVLSLTTLAKTFAGMMALRFVLGCAEAGIGSAWMLITAMFWTKAEMPLRMSFWLGCNGLSQLIGAGISWGLGHTHNPHITPWQLIFMVVGLGSFVAGIVCFVFMPSSPKQALFFSHEEAIVAVWRVRSNRTGIKHHTILWYQVREAVCDPKIYLSVVCGLSLGLINGAVSNFLTTLLKSFGYGALKSVLYQMPGGAFQFITIISGGWITTHVPNTLVLVTALAYVPGLGGLIGILTIPLSKPLHLAACAWMLPITGLAIILTWTIVAANFAGHTKRTFANGAQFTAYAAGNIISPFFFFPSEAPRYPTAIRALCAIYGVGIFSTILLGIYMWRQNVRRATLPISEELVNEAGFADYTDYENKGFQYKI
ncbi:Major Facilitator Superfamily protein [Sporothrix schenckii 1099-18]|uniref:Major facilitator superfamily (MFS) profile domain-containing protein n=2 Tax=Sporothrix schenckii TaxID=29908 RepID=U7PYQ8_SPOS1|nr:Major Facilitator Superfamily protein [Sporothrix schenckii 1099-18]ERS99605.1 hypothetical protein HMPREF1624_02965 [Sporothrix schenckii ATCC 58251]KJR86053.1 Major Facilitator Superfamily protein [Sporothrix schenckii 1099-18]